MEETGGFYEAYKDALCPREAVRAAELQGDLNAQSALLKSGLYNFLWLERPGTQKHGVGTPRQKALRVPALKLPHCSLVEAGTSPTQEDLQKLFPTGQPIIPSKKPSAASPDY